MHQGLPLVESYPHALHSQRIVVVSTGRTMTLCRLTWVSCTYYGDDQKHHNLGLQPCQT